MVCHQQRHSWDENFVPHWTLYGLSNKGNNQALTKKSFSLGIMFVRNYTSGQANCLPGITRKTKGQFLYEVQVGNQFWIRHKNQIRPRYTAGNLVDSKPIISFDLLMDTFELLSPSPLMRTNVNGSDERPYRTWPKCCRTRVKHLQVNPKCACYS